MSDIKGNNIQQEFSSLVSKIENGTYLSPNDAVVLKMAISPINNIITKALEYSFINWLRENEIISNAQYGSAFTTWEDTGANTNGYDIYIEGKDEEKPIVAEIKANVPVDKTKYGAAQINQIKEDVKNLLNGKERSQVPTNQIKNCYKFQVMLETNIDETDTEAAIENLVKKNIGKKNEGPKKGMEDCVIIKDNIPALTTANVYIKQISLPASFDLKKIVDKKAMCSDIV